MEALREKLKSYVNEMNEYELRFFCALYKGPTGGNDNERT